MSRFLTALAAGGGNIPPTLSVARALLDRGHEVRVITDPVLEPEVRAAGADFVSWSSAPHRFDLDPSSDLARDWEARTPMAALPALGTATSAGLHVASPTTCVPSSSAGPWTSRRARC